MKNNDQKILKNFVSEIKLPKYFYAQNLMDFIDNHMIALSQVIRILNNEKPEPKHIEMLQKSKNDYENLPKISNNDLDVINYIFHFNEIINILETDVLASYGTTSNYELNSDTVGNIINHLNDVGYRITGDCPNADWIGYDRNGTKGSDNAAFCVKAVNVGKAYHNDIDEKCSNDKCQTTYDDFPSMIYYDVILFYQLDVPVLKEVMNFKMYGSTKVIFG